MSAGNDENIASSTTDNAAIVAEVMTVPDGSRDPWRVLGCDPPTGADRAARVAAAERAYRCYRRRCLALHPDKTQHPDAPAALQRVMDALARVESACDHQTAVHGGPDADLALAMMALHAARAPPARCLRCGESPAAPLTSSAVPASSVFGSLFRGGAAPGISRLGLCRACELADRPKCLSCGALTTTGRSQCASCIGGVAKAGRCSRMGCLRPVAAPLNAGAGLAPLCDACRSRPVKCATFGCLRRVTPPITLCPLHQ